MPRRREHHAPDWIEADRVYAPPVGLFVNAYGGYIACGGIHMPEAIGGLATLSR